MELGAFGFSVTAILNSQKDDEAWKRKRRGIKSHLLASGKKVVKPASKLKFRKHLALSSFTISMSHTKFFKQWKKGNIVSNL